MKKSLDWFVNYKNHCTEQRSLKMLGTFVGREVNKNKEEISILQQQYNKNLLEKYWQTKSNAVVAPMASHVDIKAVMEHVQKNSVSININSSKLKWESFSILSFVPGWISLSRFVHLQEACTHRRNAICQWFTEFKVTYQGQRTWEFITGNWQQKQSYKRSVIRIGLAVIQRECRQMDTSYALITRVWASKAPDSR